MENQKQLKPKIAITICVVALVVAGIAMAYNNMQNIMPKQEQGTQAEYAGILQVGQAAPDFKLPAFPSGTVALREYLGKKNVILAFYPRDNSANCTDEMCAFSDDLPEFKKDGIELVGISCDSVESHERFSKDYNLGQLLLSDPDGKVASSYGVFNTSKSRARRVLFVIDKKGIIRYVHKGMPPDSSQLIAIVDKLTSGYNQ